MEKQIPVSKPFISEREKEYVIDALQSGWVSSLGRYVDAFEKGFAEYCGVDYALSVSNGTVGLHLALAALDIGHGDEVIVPDLTFIATANAVAHAGAKPIIADIDPDTLCIDVDAVRKVLTPRTKAIVPVHLYGHPADMDPLLELANEHGIKVLEDAAEAHGATYKGSRVGGLGFCGVFSFYGNKIITTGEGGMLTTNSIEFYRRAKSLRDHAMDPKRRYWHLERGFNYRLTNLQAALGVAQLEQIDSFLDSRNEIVNWYREYVKTSPRIRLNHQASWAKNAYWMVCLEVDWLTDDLREQFMSALRARGIDTRPYFYPISAMGLYSADPTPVATRKAKIGINLPTYVELKRDDVMRIGGAINDELDALGRGAA